MRTLDGRLLARLKRAVQRACGTTKGEALFEEALRAVEPLYLLQLHRLPATLAKVKAVRTKRAQEQQQKSAGVEKKET